MTLQMQGQEYSIRFYDDSNGMSQWHITRVQQDKNGIIWLSTWNGLNRFDGKDFDCFKVQPGDGNDVISDRVRDFLIDSDGTFLCRIDDTIFRFDPRSCRFTSVSADVQKQTIINMDKERNSRWGVPHDVTFGETTLHGVHHEFKDQQGITWLVGQNGFYKVMQKNKPFTFVEEVPHETVRCMYQDRQGHIWIASKANGRGEVTVFDSDMNLIGRLGADGRLHKEHTPFCDVFSIFQDSYGQIWIGSKPEGLFRVNPNDLFAGKPSMEHLVGGKAVYDIIQDPNGCMWLAVFDDGIYRIPNPKAAKPTIQRMRDAWGSKYPDACMKVRRVMYHDKLILATTTAGFIVIDGTQGKDYRNVTINHHHREANRSTSMSSSATMDLLSDNNGHIIVTTESGGVNIVNEKDLRNKTIDFRYITEERGLNSDVVHSALMVGDELILQTNIGLVKLASDYHNPLCFGASFWNANFRFSDARPLLTKDNRLLLSLEQGVISVPVSSLTDNGYVPHIALTRIAVPGEPALLGVDDVDTLRLKPGQRDVTVRFAAIDYSDSEDVRYATRLLSNEIIAENDTSSWTIASTSREITLFNLDPGTYSFQIRSTNAAGMWVDNCRTLTIIVEPRFVETTIAKVLLFLLIAAIIAGITYTFIYIRGINHQRQETLEAYLSLLEASQAAAKAQQQSANLEKATGGNQPVNDAPAEEHPSAPVVLVDPEDDAFMKRLIKFVEENIGNSDVGVDEMANATATSRSSLNRKMKGLLGVTPADFLKEARMKHAIQLLRTTKLSTTELAYACGFSDPKYFSKCFKATTGMSPREYSTLNKS